MTNTESKRKVNPLALVLVLSAVFFLIFIVISAALFMRRTQVGWEEHSKKTSIFSLNGAVGVVELNGVIMDSKKTLKDLKRFEDSKDIKAVVLRLNSPGGSVAPSQEIYDAVKTYPKPLVVSMGSVAASGAFYIACGAKRVFANPGTLTGSIGVIMEFANMEKLYEWAKIRRYALKTGRFKDSGSSYRDMQPEEKELLQKMLDDVLAQFKQAVVEGRKMSMEKVSAIADGRIMTGSQAKRAGLVDDLGSIDEAIKAAAKLAGLKDDPRVIYQHKEKFRFMDLFFNDDQDEETRSHGVIPGAISHLLGDIIESDAAHATAPGIYWLWNGAY